MTTLRQAAIAVIERWDAPMWRDTPSTARYMKDLREALEAPLLHTFLNEAKKAGITHLVQPKEAMQMALDALQSCAENTENPMKTRDALNALRAVLEAPEHEPVGVIRHLDELNAEWTQRLPIGTKLYATPVEAPNIKALQASGKGPAPCARFCEAKHGSQVLQEKYYFMHANGNLLKVERDALLLANRDLSNWFDALKADHDALKAAGKIAIEAIEDALSWVEAAHRPPLCDKHEIGRMVMIRLHALASLKDTAEQLRKGSAQ